MAKYTARQKAECAEREVKQRRKVFGRRVSEGRMSEAFASEQIALMEEIAADYRAQAEADDPDFFTTGGLAL